MLRLFGAPSERVFAAYEEVAPLAEGWRGAGGALPAASAARARAAVRRLLPRARPSASRCATLSAEHRATGVCACPARRAAVGVGDVHARDPRRAPAPVPARAGGRRAPLPPAADARGGGPRPVELAAPAAARVCAVRRDHLPGGSARPAHGRGGRAAGRAAGDPRARRRPPGRLPPGAALRARLPPPLRPVPGALPRGARFTPSE